MFQDLGRHKEVTTILLSEVQMLQWAIENEKSEFAKVSHGHCRTTRSSWLVMGDWPQSWRLVSGCNHGFLSLVL